MVILGGWVFLMSEVPLYTGCPDEERNVTALRHDIAEMRRTAK